MWRGGFNSPSKFGIETKFGIRTHGVNMLVQHIQYLQCISIGQTVMNEIVHPGAVWLSCARNVYVSAIALLLGADVWVNLFPIDSTIALRGQHFGPP